MNREDKMMAHFESVTNIRYTNTDKALMTAAMKWADSHPSKTSIAKYLYEKKGYAITLNGDIPSFEETMKDIKQYDDYKRKQWMDSHPVNQWHKVGDRLPPRRSEYSHLSIEVWATDGVDVYKTYYDYFNECWDRYSTHWMLLPELPKEE